MKNSVMPYLIIAVIGIGLVLAVSYVGIDQQKAIQDENNDNGSEENANENGNDENGNTENADDNEGGETAGDPDKIFQNNCAQCHGDDLKGDVGPDLTDVGSRHSEDEINDIITNGTDNGMPGGLVNEDETETLAKWLSEKK